MKNFPIQNAPDHFSGHIIAPSISSIGSRLLTVEQNNYIHIQKSMYAVRRYASTNIIWYFSSSSVVSVEQPDMDEWVVLENIYITWNVIRQCTLEWGEQLFNFHTQQPPILWLNY